ncbi:Methyltransferase domain-containing protein [Saccharicrinis carchari]|uniref:Methyltransferase domain-containing protein n=2 Tax=Saccharicrinis carchari TaxID=1168039 RepID=A0A521B992_SACCC|nr:Methyltransferase domain-containing protein [Saccharicrinis carchari]
MDSDFYKNRRTVEKYIQMAKGFDGRDLIQKLKLYLLPHSHVLELGSGPGADFAILRKDFNVIGSDYSTEFLNRLRMRFPKDVFIELDAAKMDTALTFDCIYSNKVLHHLTNEELECSIQRQYEMLSANGIICHSFWKGSGTENFKGMFVNNHTEASLKDFFSHYFNILELSSYKEFETEDSLLYIGSKKKP